MKIYVSYFRAGEGYRVFMDEIPGFSATGRTIDEARRRMVELMARTIEQGREECYQRQKAQRVEIVEDITEHVEELIRRLGTQAIHVFGREEDHAEREPSRPIRKAGH
jgi:predicted RNase H-like HicB family nuclease